MYKTRERGKPVLSVYIWSRGRAAKTILEAVEECLDKSSARIH